MKHFKTFWLYSFLIFKNGHTVHIVLCNIQKFHKSCTHGKLENYVDIQMLLKKSLESFLKTFLQVSNICTNEEGLDEFLDPDSQ